MGHPLRIFSRPQNIVSEITQVTFQHRALLRPGLCLNARIVGALARAQELYPVKLHGFVFLSSHFHIQATFEDAGQMASFMCHFTSKLSKEISCVHDWLGTVFPERYHHVELSQEPGIELARLRYLLSNSCKESLVTSPLDWPGVSSAEALITGEPMRGVWIDRTAMAAARARGKRVSEADFAVTKELRLEPLPSLAHLSSREYRQVIVEMVREIEKETLLRHREDGTTPLGVERILSTNPHRRPKDIPRSPRPWFHALSRRVRKAMRDALTWIVAAYREAARRFREGEFDVEFPEGTFPPSRPFVRVMRLGPLEPG